MDFSPTCSQDGTGRVVVGGVQAEDPTSWRRIRVVPAQALRPPKGYPVPPYVDIMTIGIFVYKVRGKTISRRTTLPLVLLLGASLFVFFWAD